MLDPSTITSVASSNAGGTKPGSQVSKEEEQDLREFVHSTVGSGAVDHIPGADVKSGSSTEAQEAFRKRGRRGAQSAGAERPSLK
jgi:hypothetical protein